MINRKILARVEYTSLGLSVLGTIATAATGQIVYAASPLISSLFLNIVNRNELAKQTSLNAERQVKLVANSWANDNTYLKRQIKTLEKILETKDNVENTKQNNEQSLIEISQNVKNIQSRIDSLQKERRAELRKSNLSETETAIQAIKIIEESNFNFVSLQELKRQINISKEQTIAQISNYLERQIKDFNLAIADNKPIYKLVYDRYHSRHVLIEALKQGKERIILVCPWITKYGADEEVIDLCEKFLQRGGRLEIGWGHLSDTTFQGNESIVKETFIEKLKTRKKANFWYLDRLEKFEKLQQYYPDSVTLKVLGTHEKFLVCDRAYAMIGSHNFLTSSSQSLEREIGLLTNDKNIIDDLIHRFEDGANLKHQKEKPYNSNLKNLIDLRSDRIVRFHNYYVSD